MILLMAFFVDIQFMDYVFFIYDAKIGFFSYFPKSSKKIAAHRDARLFLYALVGDYLATASSFFMIEKMKMNDTRHTPIITAQSTQRGIFLSHNVGPITVR